MTGTATDSLSYLSFISFGDEIELISYFSNLIKVDFIPLGHIRSDLSIETEKVSYKAPDVLQTFV